MGVARRASESNAARRATAGPSAVAEGYRAASHSSSNCRVCADVCTRVAAILRLSLALYHPMAGFGQQGWRVGSGRVDRKGSGIHPLHQI